MLTTTTSLANPSLERLFGNSPEFWLNAQRAADLWDAAQAIKGDVARIRPLNAA
jgi:plasmid maintenance system antidote protein VapI